MNLCSHYRTPFRSFQQHNMHWDHLPPPARKHRSQMFTFAEPHCYSSGETYHMPWADIQSSDWGVSPETPSQYPPLISNPSMMSPESSTVDYMDDQPAQDFDRRIACNPWPFPGVEQDDTLSEVSSVSGSRDFSDYGSHNYSSSVTLAQAQPSYVIHRENVSTQRSETAWESRTLHPTTGHSVIKQETVTSTSACAYISEENTLPASTRNRSRLMTTRKARLSDTIAPSTKQRQTLSKRIRASASKTPKRPAQQTYPTSKESRQPKRICPRHPKMTFKNMIEYENHVRDQHPRPFVCIFRNNGCSDSFEKKNEWKRHIRIQHLQLDHYNCALCTIPRDHSFNRKDLFKTHLERMHFHKDVAGERPQLSFRNNAWTKDNISELVQTCRVHVRKPPENSTCGFCGERFAGKDSWNECMEHVGLHFDRGCNISDWKVDKSVQNWLIREGLVEATGTGVDHSWTFKDPKMVRSLSNLSIAIHCSDAHGNEEDAEGEEE
ncbi:hypothetical protein L228DRAFT_260645 [Xylona heveae TC161]|uniref:C2H2-type domain-containing protein n=1 Tax=Xylona heveae (strain CBS 132557 / TC161) TaxID=1328760 RepID=A0A161TDH5_XYLHT|nr:hypothetical protein L228DRAFT_260645 [Xylona heveae TC161]KZF23897.1 hypothetical protein L228DRAFT_260645 [Xylona heveae TC161]